LGATSKPPRAFHTKGKGGGAPQDLGKRDARRKKKFCFEKKHQVKNLREDREGEFKGRKKEEKKLGEGPRIK